MVMALENGGDDYMTKPFHPEVLIAKVKAILRRTYGEYADGTEKNEITYQGLSLDIERNVASYEERRVTLTVTERLLLTLFGGKGK